MSDPIDGVSLNGPSKTLEICKAMTDNAEPQSSTHDVTNHAPGDEMSTVADNTNPGTNETPEKIDPKNVETHQEKVLESFEKIDEAIEDAYVDDISQDTDKDGIPDFLDATGNDTLVEQAYDNEAERLAAEKHAFVSMLAMLSNFDLTNFKRTTVNGDPTSLSAIAAAGCAQVALMHSHRLSEASEMRPLGPASLKKLLQDHQQKTADEKRTALQNAGDLLARIPANEKELIKAYPELEKLSPAQRSRVLNNLEVMKRSLVTPASAEA